MYIPKNDWMEQINIDTPVSQRTSIDSSMHWLNSSFHKCDKRLYPYSIL